jgi:hypothetical protein
MTKVARQAGMAEAAHKRRGNNHAWKHVYGVDRGYTARVDRLKERQDEAVRLGLPRGLRDVPDAR